MSNSINTNIAAFYAQQNITTASNSATENVARLSSGNAIIQASDNVAALAVGTSIGTQVSVLTTAQNNAAQGTSLLQVADGALAQIQSILQQQQSIANQAQSGTLTNTDRGFLNEEFQTLTNEIDALAQGTTFNGVQLINGAIAGGANVNTNTTNGSTLAPTSAQIISISSANAVVGSTVTVTVDGQPAITLTLGTGTGQAGVGSTSLDTADNIAAALNNSGDSELANFRFVASAGAASSGVVSAYYTGSTSSTSNIPPLTIAATNESGSAITATASPNFNTPSKIVTITGTVNALDTINIGGNTIKLVANATDPSGYSTTTSPPQADIGTGANITSTALSNLAALLNTGTFSNLSGITFTSDATHLYAQYTGGGSQQPVLSTTYTNNSPLTFNGSAGATVNSGPQLFNFTAAGTTATLATITVDGDSITTVANGGSPVAGTSFALGTTKTGTAAALVTFLNANAGQTGFTNLAGLYFTSSAGTIYASNEGSAAKTVTQATALNTSSASSNVVTVATLTSVTAPSLIANISAGIPAAGDAIVVDGIHIQFAVNGTAVSGTGTSSSPYIVALNATPTLTNSLSALVTFLNTHGGSPIDSNHIVYGSDSSGNLYAQADNGSNGSVATSYTVGSALGFTGVTGATIAAPGVVGLGAGVTSAVGAPTGSLFVVDNASASATNYGNGVDLSNVANNAAFLGAFGGTGSIGAITANYINTGTNSTSGVQFSVVVGNDTYTTNTIANTQLTSSTAPVTLTFTGSNTTTTAAEGGSFTLLLKPQAGDITSQTAASQLATGINTSLSTVSAYQNRNVLSFNNNYTAEVNGVTTGSLQGATLTFNSNDFTNPSISSVNVAAPSTGSTDAKITAVVNGDTYTTTTGIGDSFTAKNQLVLINQSNPDQTLTLTLGPNGSANLSSASDASAFQTALSNALGLNNVSGGLTFQLGSTAAANVSVTINSATSSSLFGGAALDVSTAGDAATAAAAVSTALNTVTSLRSSVGAYETQFNFASAALQSSVQNETAAESQLLDTNVATESTSYATNQVKLQAGISVLAQANQQAQALLKLLG